MKPIPKLRCSADITGRQNRHNLNRPKRKKSPRCPESGANRPQFATNAPDC